MISIQVFRKILESNKNINFSKTILVPFDMPTTQPYWLKEQMGEGYYNVTDSQIIGQPDADPAYMVNAVIKIKDQVFQVCKSIKI